MATTTNFNWSTPDDTSLVKDGAAAIRTLGSSIDTSMAELKGGTTGQVLSKTSNTDMDFTWIAVDPLTILDAKGDLISATAADTPARLAVGSNNQVLTADSSTATGLKWATPSSGAPSWSLISTTSLTTGSSYSITGLSGYNQLLIRVNGVTTTAADAFNYTLNNITTSSYTRAISYISGGAALSINSISGTTTALATNSNSPAGTTINGSFLINGANGAGLKCIQQVIGANASAASNNTQWGTVTFSDTNVISSFQINATFGTFNAGTITVHGSVI